MPAHAASFSRAGRDTRTRSKKDLTFTREFITMNCQELFALSYLDLTARPAELGRGRETHETYASNSWHLTTAGLFICGEVL